MISHSVEIKRIIRMFITRHGFSIVLALQLPGRSSVFRTSNSESNNHALLIFSRFECVDFRYRKFHPIGEQVQNTVEPELITFRTDFNVTFGIAVCFDLIFDTPMIALMKHGVRNFVFPTMWNAELPYTAGGCTFNIVNSCELSSIFSVRWKKFKVWYWFE